MERKHTKEVTEAEVIDVLFGGAEQEVEVRVRRAVHENLEAAEWYSKWSAVVDLSRREAKENRRIYRNARRRTMEQLSAERFAMSKRLQKAPVPAPIEIKPSLNISKIKSRPAIMAFALSSAAVALLAFGLWNWIQTPQGARIVSADGAEIWTVDTVSGANLSRVKAGATLALPSTVRITGHGKIEAVMGDGVIINNLKPSELTIVDERNIQQKYGKVCYEIENGRSGTPQFSVHVPQGEIVDFGTKFCVTNESDDITRARVSSGEIRIRLNNGSGEVPLRADEEARFTAAALMKTFSPPNPNALSFDKASAETPSRILLTSDQPGALSQAREIFQTRLIRKGPSPCDQWCEEPPTGAEKVEYLSQGRKLIAWISTPENVEQTAPAIVYAHDGYSLGHDAWRETEMFRRAGYVVMTPSWRGENGNPGYFECLYGEVDDLISAGYYLTGVSGVDPGRVLVAGRGIGGALAILAAQRTSPFAGAEVYDPITDPAPLYEHAPFNTQDPSELLLRTPYRFAASLQIPLRMRSTGTRPEILQGAEMMFSMAQAKQRACEWYPAENQPLSLSRLMKESVAHWRKNWQDVAAPATQRQTKIVVRNVGMFTP